MKRIYLDYAATTPVDPCVFKAMAPFLKEAFGNPSTLYSYGEEARQAVEEARKNVSGLVNARTEEIVFTSGGTEANNLAIKGVARARKKQGKHLITSAIEHHSVIGPCHALEKEGFEVTCLPVDSRGMVDPAMVEKAITPGTVLISIMHANNEIGSLQPIDEIGKIAFSRGICFHTDAIQSQGHVPLDVDRLKVDLLSMSAHKIYGPKGIGALYIRTGTDISPILDGGEQEENKRAGTENVAGIAGFGQAAKMALTEIGAEGKRISRLRDRFIRGLLEKIPEVYLNGHPVMRLPGNVNISIAHIEGESVCLNLDFEDICAATGSACTTSSVEPSHVLLATGRSRDLAHGSVRFSMGKWTRWPDLEKVLEVLPPIVERLRSMSPTAS